MTLTRKDVEKVSLLGRLRLTERELETMTGQLDAIVDYMATLAEVDVTGVEPMAHAIDLHDVFREDVLKPSLPREEALANAPDEDGECYRVPAVL